MSLVAEHVSRRYGLVQALDDVSVTFERGQIHAVVGENGAGKSTLMGVLGGFVVPDTGQVSVEGRPVPPGAPRTCRRLGIAMVHQHFMLVPAFTVAENLALARATGLSGTSLPEREAAPSLARAADLGWSLDPHSRTESLPVGVQQRIEIVKALDDQTGYLILDEPTAVLTPDQVDDLFTVLRRWRDRGKAVVLIAHNLGEVLRVADHVTVMRSGRLVFTGPVTAIDREALVRHMVGESVAATDAVPSPQVEPVLDVQGLRVLGDRGEMAVQDVSFTVAKGEVFGIGGVDGNGQSELAEVLSGFRRPVDGQIEWLAEVPMVSAYIPADRHSEGLALRLSVFDNLLPAGSRIPQFARNGWLRLGALRQWARELVGQYGIKTPGLGTPAGSLSGGNQQKVVVARQLALGPNLVVAVNPTRGLDVKAASFVHAQLIDRARSGGAVVVFSTDSEELASLANRRLVMSRGRLFDSFEEALASSGLS